MAWNYEDYTEMNTHFGQDEDGYVVSESGVMVGGVNKSIKYVMTPEEGEDGEAWEKIADIFYDIFCTKGSGINYIRVKAVLE